MTEWLCVMPRHHAYHCPNQRIPIRDRARFFETAVFETADVYVRDRPVVTESL
jgi:hypothetical protein